MAGKREFNARRLHSLLGVVPIGLFLVFHLITNYNAVYGPEAFNSAVGLIQSLPFLLLLEIFGIYLPILYHAILGVYIAFTAKNNVSKYGYFRNWMFKLQRYTGIITLIFIAWHVWQTRIAAALGLAEVNYSMMADILSSPFMFWFYIIGVISTVFHFANGLWSFLVSWGITQSPRSQRIASYVSIAVFIFVAYLGVSSILAFAFGA